MAKVFISYKHKDSNVYNYSDFFSYEIGKDTDNKITARHYVNFLETLLTKNGDNIFKGEKDNESLAEFSNDTIDTKLKGKIFDSSVTIVLVSPNMFDRTKIEKEQWIPNEISYSLRNDKRRGGKTSRTNAMLAVVLPDLNKSYEYLVTFHNCVFCNTRTWNTPTLFYLLRENMFNKINKDTFNCNSCKRNEIHRGNDHSFILPVLFEDFIKEHKKYIEIASNIRDNHLSYETHKLKVQHN